jgi:uncharacterized protein involved in response to NO
MMTGKSPIWASEPFRLLFPLGMGAAIVSVLLWPAFYSGHLGFYPLHAHARALIPGFIGACVIGFAGTAFPRLAGVRSFQTWEVTVLTTIWGVSTLAYLFNHIVVGDLLQIALWLSLVLWAGFRLRQRQDTPPPGFILVGAGVLSLIVGLTLQLPQPDWMPVFSGWLRLWSRELIYLVFPVMVFLGVAPYFFPKIMGGDNRHEFESSRSLPSGWLPRAGIALTMVLVFWSGCLLRSRGVPAGGWLLALGITAYLISEIPMLPSRVFKGSLASGLSVGLLALVGSLFSMAFLKTWNIPFFHLGMIGGITLCLMMVSIRVIYGHSGQRQLTQGWLWWANLMMLLLVASVITRVSADWFPSSRESHLVFASVWFTLAGGVWFIAIRRQLLIPDPEPN